MRRASDGLSESMEEGWTWKARAESKTDNHNGVAAAVRATANATFVKAKLGLVKLGIGSKQRQSTIQFGPASGGDKHAVCVCVTRLTWGRCR
eukprot:2125113-Prymnesium_polylepis.1